MKAVVGIIMGSDSDLPVMKDAAEILAKLGIAYEITIVSAHRTPQRMFEYATTAEGRGLKVVIAGAGGSAHLPGMVASLTPLPVIGVPIQSKAMSGMDSLYSIVQMPPGVPVATVSINGAKNAGILAAQILGSADTSIRKNVTALKKELEEQVKNRIDELKASGDLNAS